MSILIFRYLGFIIIQTRITRSLFSATLAIVSGALYGTLQLTLLINQEGISWHGHLFGLIGGLVSGFLILSSPSQKKRKAVIKIDCPIKLPYPLLVEAKQPLRPESQVHEQEQDPDRVRFPLVGMASRL